MTELPEYVLERRFDAPPETVWRCFCDPVLLARWYGPGVETVVHKLELRPGGVWLNEMKFGENSDLSRMDFIEVTEGQRIVYHHSSVNADWEPVPNAMMPVWPMTFLTTITLTADGAATKVRLTQTPLNASDKEIAAFAEMMSGMDKGWGSGFALIEEIVAELTSAAT